MPKEVEPEVLEVSEGPFHDFSSDDALETPQRYEAPAEAAPPAAPVHGRPMVQRRFLTLVVVLCAVAIAVILGTSVFANELSKEVFAINSTLVSASDGTTVKVASTQLNVAENGKLTSVETGQAVSTSAALYNITLTSNLKDAIFDELRYFKVISPTGARLTLMVHGTARIPEPNSLHGSILKILTLAGTITLDGPAMTFSDNMAPLFVEAGFEVHENGRRLNLVAMLVGFFNSLVEAAPELKVNVPKLPASFYAEMTVYERCTEEDDCKYSVSECDAEEEDPADMCFEEEEEGVPFVNPGAVIRGDGLYYKKTTERSWAQTIGQTNVVRTVVTSERWPGHELIRVFNGTHRLQFQRYNNSDFLCTTDPWTTPSMIPQGSSIGYLGMEKLNGKSVRHFTVKSKVMDLHYYDHAGKPYRLLDDALEMDGFFDKFEESKPLSADMFSLEPKCKPKVHEPPAMIEELAGMGIIEENPSWGTEMEIEEMEEEEVRRLTAEREERRRLGVGWDGTVTTEVGPYCELETAPTSLALSCSAEVGPFVTISGAAYYQQPQTFGGRVTVEVSVVAALKKKLRGPLKTFLEALDPFSLYAYLQAGNPEWRSGCAKYATWYGNNFGIEGSAGIGVDAKIGSGRVYILGRYFYLNKCPWSSKKKKFYTDRYSAHYLNVKGCISGSIGWYSKTACVGLYPWSTSSCSGYSNLKKANNKGYHKSSGGNIYRFWSTGGKCLYKWHSSGFRTSGKAAGKNFYFGTL